MKLESETEIKIFEEYLKKYEISISGKHLNHLSLMNMSELLENEDNAGRVFTAYLDIQLSFTHIFHDISNIIEIWNDNFSKGNLEGGSFLDSELHFNKKMDMHYQFTSFVLRYRAIWDKIMGFLLLVLTEDEYKAFDKAKSRKKAFKKSVEKANIPEEFYAEVLEKLENFDNKFRTGEAHGTGVLRKFVFDMCPINDNAQKELLEYWDFLNETISKIGIMIHYAVYSPKDEENIE